MPAAQRSLVQRCSTIAVTSWLLIIVMIATWFRLVDLHWLPGINADEAWCGYQAWALLNNPSDVSWLTPTGPPLCPTFTLPQALYLWFSGPTPVGLRIISVLSGIALFMVPMLIGRPHASWTERFTLALLLYVLPINLAYSRFGWFASQSCLACYLVLVSATLGQSVRTLLWFVLALLVHPTNLFLMPIWLMVLLNAWLAKSPNESRSRSQTIAPPAGSDSGRPSVSRPTMAILLTLCMMVLSVGLVAWLMRGRLAEISNRVSSRAVDGSEGIDFLCKLVELHSGSTIYRFIVGEIPASYTLGRDGITATILIVLLLTGLFTCRGQLHRATVLSFLLGTLLTLVGFYLVAGVDGIRPHYERYAMVLIIPVIWSCVIVWETVARRFNRFGRLVPPLLLGTLMLFDFRSQYLLPLQTTGSKSHVTFHSAGIDPKWAATEAIKRYWADRSPVQATGNRPIVVFAPSWWTRWPAHYFLAHQNGQLPRFHIIETGEVEISQTVDLSQIDVVMSLNPLAIEQAFQQLDFPGQRDRQSRKIVYVYVKK